MPLYYKPKQSSIASKDGKKKWHLLLVKSKKMVETNKVAELIAEKASLTPGDVHNTLRNLTTVMRDLLMNSRTVRLDGLGTFTMVAKTTGKGVDNKEDVSPTQIKSLKVRFTPEYTRPAGGKATRALFDGLAFEYWGDKPVADSTGADDGDGEDDKGGYVDPTT